MLNCDWFQPYKHVRYGVGVLYLTVLNLPCSIRFKPENVLIAGIIPGPKEPQQYGMNSYLRSLVKELNALWRDGISIKCGSEAVRVHAALIATVYDIPAASKLGGLLGHNSSHACNWRKYYGLNILLKQLAYQVQLDCGAELCSSHSVLHLLYPRIKEICITCELTIGGEPVLAVNPIRKKIFL